MEEKEMTPREKEVLKRLVAGLSNKEIADELFISVHTVKAHLESIFEKTGAINRVQAAVFAVNNKLV